MDHILYSTFLDDQDVAERIYALVVDCLLGPEQAEKIRLRYYDMYRNFFKYSKEESIKYGCPTEVLEFSKGVEPFKPRGYDHGACSNYSPGLQGFDGTHRKEGCHWS